MSSVLHPDLPSFVAFGEALTELIGEGPDRWHSVNGGAPWQVAVAMSRLGELSAFAGGISRDLFGQSLWQASADACLDLRFIQQFDRAPLLTVVHQEPRPGSFFIGDDSADLHFAPEGLPAGWRRPLRCTHFGGISLARQPLAERLVQLAAQLKVEGKLISYDPGFHPSMDSRYDDTLEQMCRLADVIKVSEADLRGLFRCNDHHTGVAQISAWNPGALLLLTRGAEGGTLFQGNVELSARAPEIELVDGVGAGDASMAGLLYSLLRHKGAEPAQHLRFALAAGAGACMAAGASPPSLALVQTLAVGVQLQA